MNGRRQPMWRSRCCRPVADFLFEYETPRVVVVRSTWLGIIYRIFQLGILIYVLGFVFIISKSYQDFDDVDSSVVTKVKGIIRRNNSGEISLWDSTDFVIPPQESNAFFVATNMWFLRGQTQGICTEDSIGGGPNTACVSDRQCPAETYSPEGNGYKTGRCNQQTRTCEISGWCPTEIDVAPTTPVFSGHSTATVLVKNHIAYPKFNVKRRNILERFGQEYLQNCRYHPEEEPLCPIFNLRDMVHYANESFDKMAVKGGIIGMHIDWNCDLDYGVEACLPHYSFRRLDSDKDKIAKGWNFRTAYYHYDNNGTLYRDLAKYWGIRFVILVSGKAGRFCIVNFALHLGSSLGLLGLASALCEIFLSYHRSSRFKDLKFEHLKKGNPMKPQRRHSNMSAPQLQKDTINWNGYVPDHRQQQVRSASASPNRTRHVSVTPVLDRRIDARCSYGSKKSMFSMGNKVGDPVWI